MLASLTALGAGLGTGGVLGFGLKLAANLEQAEIGFKVLLNSGDKAKSLLNDLRAFADVTPFESADLIKASTALLAARVELQDILPSLSVLGDISMGSAEKLMLIAKAYTDVKNKGKLAGQEIRQFAENGVGILAVLSQMYFGTTENTVAITNMSEQGLISFADVQRALISMTQAGGAFHGMMAEQSQTLQGRWSTLVDTAKRLAIEIGEKLMPAAKNLVEMFANLATKTIGVVQGMNQTVVKAIAMGAAWAAMMVIGYQIVKMVRAIVVALKAMAAAQTITQALSGPRGWAVLAAGIAAAAISISAVNAAFAPIEANLTETSAIATKAANEIERLNKGLPAIGAESAKALGLQEAEKAAKSLQHELDRLRQKGEHLAESLRTPAEILLDSAREFQKLLSGGFINADVFARAMQKAKDDFSKSTFVKEIRLELASGVGAVTRGTVAGFSAVQEGGRVLSLLAEQRKADEKKIDLAREANRLLATIAVELKPRANTLQVEIVGIGP